MYDVRKVWFTLRIAVDQMDENDKYLLCCTYLSSIYGNTIGKTEWYILIYPDNLVVIYILPPHRLFW